jgi:hypothetical protein
MARNGIAWEEIESIIGTTETPTLPEGVRWEDKAGWVKLTGTRGCTVYVAKQKVVRHIHLSGFGQGMPGTVPPDRENGRVAAQLDMEDPNAMRYFAQILKALPNIAPTVPDRRGQRNTTMPPPSEPANDAGETAKPRRARSTTASPAIRSARGTDAPGNVPTGDPIAAAEIAQKRIDRLMKLAEEQGAQPDQAVLAKLREVVDRGRTAQLREVTQQVLEDVDNLVDDRDRLMELVDKLQV